MLSAHDVWWWSALVLLVPVALAARRKPPRKREPRQGPPPQRSSWRFPLLAAGVVAVTVVLVIALRMASSREARSPSLAAAGALDTGMSAEALAGVVAEQWKAMATSVCPRFAAFQRGEAGVPSARVWELVSVECLGLLCEHPEQLEAKRPGASSQLEPVCKALFSVMKKQLEVAASANSNRLACPTAILRWSKRPWSPSNHLGFYREVRGCMERSCAEAGAGPEADLFCESAAELAEGLGDAPAAAKLRQRARAAPVPEEGQEEERAFRSVRIMARRWSEACQQGSQEYCERVAGFCETEREVSDVCPKPGKASAPAPRGG